MTTWFVRNLPLSLKKILVFSFFILCIWNAARPEAFSQVHPSAPPAVVERVLTIMAGRWFATVGRTLNSSQRAAVYAELFERYSGPAEPDSEGNPRGLANEVNSVVGIYLRLLGELRSHGGPTNDNFNLLRRDRPQELNNRRIRNPTDQDLGLEPIESRLLESIVDHYLTLGDSTRTLTRQQTANIARDYGGSNDAFARTAIRYRAAHQAFLSGETMPLGEVLGERPGNRPGAMPADVYQIPVRSAPLGTNLQAEIPPGLLQTPVTPEMNEFLSQLLAYREAEVSQLNGRTPIQISAADQTLLDGASRLPLEFQGVPEFQIVSERQTSLWGRATRTFEALNSCAYGPRPLPNPAHPLNWRVFLRQLNPLSSTPRTAYLNNHRISQIATNVFGVMLGSTVNAGANHIQLMTGENHPCADPRGIFRPETIGRYLVCLETGVTRIQWPRTIADAFQTAVMTFLGNHITTSSSSFLVRYLKANIWQVAVRPTVINTSLELFTRNVGTFTYRNILNIEPSRPNRRRENESTDALLLYNVRWSAMFNAIPITPIFSNTILPGLACLYPNSRIVQVGVHGVNLTYSLGQSNLYYSWREAELGY